MNHPAELQVFSYLQKAMKGEATMTEEVATQVASDVKAALDKQFNSPPRDELNCLSKAALTSEATISATSFVIVASPFIAFCK